MTRPDQGVILKADLSTRDTVVKLEGFASPEVDGRWSDGVRASIRVPISDAPYPYYLLVCDVQPFIVAGDLPCQRVEVETGSGDAEEWFFRTQRFRMRSIVIERRFLPNPSEIHVQLRTFTAASPASFGINDDRRVLGIKFRSVAVIGLMERPDVGSPLLHMGVRNVSGEAGKSWDARALDGFWSRYITGPNVLDIGFRGAADGGETIVEGAIGVDLDYPGYDGKTLPFPDASQDAVFSSHCLEHIPGSIRVIQDWFRVLKVGGHIITVVPSAHLYERGRRPPSQHNEDHQRFYTPSSLLGEFESALLPNSYRVRFLEENDRDYAYSLPANMHPVGCYEIVLVIQKITPPSWSIRE